MWPQIVMAVANFTQRARSPSLSTVSGTIHEMCRAQHMMEVYKGILKFENWKSQADVGDRDSFYALNLLSL